MPANTICLAVHTFVGTLCTLRGFIPTKAKPPTGQMGHKKVCLECRVTLRRDFESGSGLGYPCPECGKPMILLPHRFRPPKKSDDKSWEAVKFLIENGFYYQHIYEVNETLEHINRLEKYVEYPENLREAKEFVEKYKNQVRKKEKGT